MRLSHLTLSLSIALMFGCGSGKSEDAAARAASDEWFGRDATTRFVRVSDRQLAWKIDRGACYADGADGICEYTVLLTKIGRRCSTCGDQTVDVELRFPPSGQVFLDAVTLKEGSGLPFETRFGSLDIPLTSEHPYEGSDRYDLTAEFIGPWGPEIALAQFQSGRMSDGYTDPADTWYTDCSLLIWAPADGEAYVSLPFDETVRAISCEDQGLVDIVIKPNDDYYPEEITNRNRYMRE